MRALMGLIKNRHGVYQARVKVRPDLQEAVATLQGRRRPRQTWLQKSLGTKDLKRANILAKPVLAEFDRIIAKAKAHIAEKPLRTSLSARDIESMANHLYASMLITDDEYRRDAPEIAQELRQLAGEPGTDPLPEFGLSRGQMADASVSLRELVEEAEAALARGDITHLPPRIDDVLDAFHIRLDTKSAVYREFGLAILRAYVRGLRTIAKRYQGEPIDSPQLITPEAPRIGDSLRSVFKDWQKTKNRAPGTLDEYTRAIELFTQMHGDLPVVQLNRTHARAFCAALQDVPHTRYRKGSLRTAPLPELVTWGRAHPEATKIANGTVNKLLGGVQAVAVWAHKVGIIPDDVMWTDPFSGIRLEEAQSNREPFVAADLRALFAAPVFTAGDRPQGGKGEAAFWLPLLSLFTGARQSELAQLTVDDAQRDEATGTPVLVFAADTVRGKRLKTKASFRTVPVHPELLRLGWLEFVAEVREEHGPLAWLFPLISPERGRGAVRAWSKWINRYMGDQGIRDTNKVFHSFRHGMTDALRAADLREDISRALVGHADTSVHGRYGARVMVQRFGMPALTRAVQTVSYPGLDLSGVTRTRRGGQPTPQDKRT